MLNAITTIISLKMNAHCLILIRLIYYTSWSLWRCLSSWLYFKLFIKL